MSVRRSRHGDVQLLFSNHRSPCVVMLYITYIIEAAAAAHIEQNRVCNCQRLFRDYLCASTTRVR